MAYRNKTYVAFASEDIIHYRRVQAWRASKHIDFDFIDAHDINIARDTSTDETIRRRLRERLASTKQVVVLLSNDALRKSKISSSFLYYELTTTVSLGLPVVFVNLNQSRTPDHSRIPAQLSHPHYTMSVSYQPTIIKYALDDYVDGFASNKYSADPRKGAYFYKASLYASLGL